MFSLKRMIWSGVLALILDFYAFNFVARNINIIATRSLERQIFAYVLNFILFFIVIYVVLTIIYYIVKLFTSKK